MKGDQIMSTSDEKKIRKEWLAYALCLLLLLVVWQLLKSTGEHRELSGREITKHLTTFQQDFHTRAMFAYLEGSMDEDGKNIVSDNTAELKAILVNLHNDLKQCQNLVETRNVEMDYYDSVEKQTHPYAFRNSMITVTILGICIMLILMLLTMDKRLFAWRQKLVVILLLSITVAVALQRPVYWGTFMRIADSSRYHASATSHQE